MQFGQSAHHYIVNAFEEPVCKKGTRDYIHYNTWGREIALTGSNFNESRKKIHTHSTSRTGSIIQ